MTDAELIELTHAVLLACLKGACSEEQAVIDLIGLYEDAGRPFIASVELLSPDNDPG
jgi:hypothetical protein